MSFTPNTTPTPNWLYNGEMKKMNETELKVVLLITRKTLGWYDPMSKGRREQDYISQSQFLDFTGQSNRAISTAIQSCVENGWIIARDKNGELCDTSEKRARRKIWYQLGSIFTKKLSGEESSQDNLVNKNHQTGEQNNTNLVKNVHSTKETNTKETIQKKNSLKRVQAKGPDPLVQDIVDYFSEKVPVVDGTPKWNRIYAKHIYNKIAGKMGRDGDDILNLIHQLIDVALRDEFHSKNCTSLKYLYNNMGKIVNTAKGPRVVHI